MNGPRLPLSLLCFAAAGIAAFSLLMFSGWERKYYFEYPSLLMRKEIRLWGIRLLTLRQETDLSAYLKENRIRIEDPGPASYLISGHRVFIPWITEECKRGSVGADLLKLNTVLTRRGKEIEPGEISAILELLHPSASPESPAQRAEREKEFIRRVWNLYYFSE